MAEDRIFKGFQLHRHLRSVELPCSWCGADVPLPAGDFSGVCIECGTVMFRHPRRRIKSGEELLASLGSAAVPVTAG